MTKLSIKKICSLVIVCALITTSFLIMNVPVVSAVDTTPVRINSDSDFDASHNVSSGNGTEGNPYIIENLCINGSGAGYCFYIGNTTKFFIIRNCSFYNASGICSNPYFLDSAIIFINVSNGMIYNNTLYYNNHSGIYLYQSDDNDVEDNEIYSNVQNGIYIAESDIITIEENIVYSNSEYGIVTQCCNNNTISYNTVSSNKYGIVLAGANSRDHIVINNTATDSTYYGIYLSSTKYTNVSYNNVSANDQSGIKFSTSQYNDVYTNLISSNGDHGIHFVISSTYNSIIENNISSNEDYGVYITSNYNSVYHNAFIDNNDDSTQGYDSGTSNEWDNGYPSGGNFWSDYSGNDDYSGPGQNATGPDGIGDTAYSIAGASSSDDNYPLIAVDEDKDGLPYYEEIDVGTDPIRNDTDFDGLWDGWHDDNTNGICDTGETWGEEQYDTNPLSIDTDGDDMFDYFEAINGTDNGGWQDPTVNNTKYAIIISAQNASSGEELWWNDIVEMNSILVDNYGYKPDNVYFLYSNGTDYAGTDDLTEYAATRENLDTVCEEINNSITSTDFLFVWVLTHGAWDGTHSLFGLWNLSTNKLDDTYATMLRDDEFAGDKSDYLGNKYLGDISNYARRVIILNPCDSGGFINDLSNSKTITMTSSKILYGADECDNWDINGDNFTEGGTSHLEFPFHTLGALKQDYLDPAVGFLDADTDDNSYISLMEVFNYNWLNNSRRKFCSRTQDTTEIAQYDDNGDGISNQNWTSNYTTETNNGILPVNGDGALGAKTYIGEYSEFKLNISQWHNYTTMKDELESFEDEFSDIMKIYDLGDSYQNREMLAVKISDNPDQNETSEPDILIDGAHHGNENISREIPIYCLHYILEKYNMDSTIKNLVDNNEIWIVPMVNPDGVTANTRYNSRYIDLNRNYDIEWVKYYDGSYNCHNGYPYDSTNASFSENETMAIRDLAYSHDFDTYASYHTTDNNYILFPWGCYDYSTSDDATFEHVGNRLKSLTNYTLLQLYDWDSFYKNGTSTDWLYNYSACLSYTIEVNDYDGIPESMISYYCKFQVPVCLYLIDMAEYF